MVERDEILGKWRAALARLTGAAPTSSTPTNSLNGHRECAQKVLRYLIARYQDDKCWGPFRGPSRGRAPRAFRPATKLLDSEVCAPEMPLPRKMRTGEQIRPALENIRRINDPLRVADDPPAVQFRLITLLILMTVLSILLAAVQRGTLATIAVALLLGGFTYWYARFSARQEKSR